MNPWPYPQGPWTPYQGASPPQVIFVPTPTPAEEPRKSKRRKSFTEEDPTIVEGIQRQINELEGLKKIFTPPKDEKKDDKKKGMMSGLSVVEITVMLTMLSPILVGLQFWLIGKGLGSIVSAVTIIAK